METTSKDTIRKFVRERYGKIARDKLNALELSQPPSCVNSMQDINNDNSFKAQGCCSPGTEFSPKNISHDLGYSKNDIESVPEGANLGLGCGNPLGLALLKKGETVVDLGSGAGFDCFLAARQVGERGRVIGIDMTPDMVSKARLNAEKIKSENVEFRLGEIENLPVADNHADIIISNCVINLSPDKQRIFQEAFRALKPGGRLSISDIVATEILPEDVQKNLELVAACIGGAATVDELKTILTEAGFSDIRIDLKNESRKIINEWYPGSNAGDYVVSAYIEAVKP
jgi:SAM-dependent methyltransferase